MSDPPPPYVMLNSTSRHGPTAGAPPPPSAAYQYYDDTTLPQYYPNPYKRNSGGESKCCLRIICCCCCFFSLLIAALSFVALYLYAFYKPQVPSYRIEDLQVKAFDVQPGLGIKSQFLMTIKADNPNNKIRLVYGEDNSIDVMYSHYSLCSGKLPSFKQGYKSTTLMQIDLEGKSSFGSGLKEAFEESRKNEEIPLMVKVKVPVKVVLGDFPLRQFKVFLMYYIVVDKLAPNIKVGIKSSKSAIRVEF